MARQHEENPWSLSDAAIQRLKLDPSKVAEFKAHHAKWDQSLDPLEQSFKRSETVTQQDLAIRINVRDSD